MRGEPDLEQIRRQIILDFKSLEDSAALSFNKAARTMIRGHCAFLIYRARLLQKNPVPSARERKRKGLQIAEEATSTKQHLENLLALQNEGGAWVFFPAWPYREWGDGLKNAIAIVGEIAKAAKLGASLPRKGGRPRLWLFEDFVQNLYEVYWNSGGRKKLSYRPEHKSYFSPPVYFIRTALAQIEKLIPDEVRAKILPKESEKKPGHALTRLIAAAMQAYDVAGKKPSRKTKKSD